jgi:hypothetical protein
MRQRRRRRGSTVWSEEAVQCLGTVDGVEVEHSRREIGETGVGETTSAR